VNESLARRYFDGSNPVGRRIAIDGSEWRTIVGIMADVRQEGLAAPSAPEVLVPMAQRRTRGPWALIRTTQDPASVVPALRAAVAAVDPQLPVGRIATLPELRDSAIRQPRFRTLLLAAFAAVALLLACLGVYGMLSYSVSERVAEFGVRMALGATAVSVTGMVIGGAAKLSLAGVAAGLALALVLARAVSTLLFGIPPHDPVTFAGAAAVVLASCVAAALLPARRATRVDPAVALRAE
jgi:putative ABC transport system permease protein